MKEPIRNIHNGEMDELFADSQIIKIFHIFSFIYFSLSNGIFRSTLQ